MKEIRIADAPAIHLPLLDEELRSALAGVYKGMSTDSQGVRVFLDDGATSNDETTARTVTLAHDHMQLSSAELTEAKEVARRDAAAAQVNAADVGAILQSAVIADTVADLREQVMALVQLVGNLSVAQGYTPAMEEEA